MRTTTLYNPIKATALFGVAILLLAVIAPASAMHKVIEGVGLKEPLEVELDFSESDYLLITASQSHADYFLLLTDKTNPKIQRRVDVGSRNILDEVFLVTVSDCVKCVISLGAVAKVDQSSPYTLKIDGLDHDDAELAKVLSHVTIAGEKRHLASIGDKELKRNSLLGALTELDAAAKISNDSWLFYVLTARANTYFLLENIDSYRAALETLVADTDQQSAHYRALALFNLAEISSDRSKIFKLLDEGLILAKQIEHDQLYARGSDSKGIILVYEGEYDAAIELFQKASSIYSDTLRWRHLLGPLHNLSWAYMRSGNIPASLAAASDQRLTAEQYSFEEHALWALYNFGLAYGQSGDRAIADTFLDEALERLEKMPLVDRTPSATQLKAFLLLEKTQRSLQYGALELANDYAVLAKKEFKRLGQLGQVANINFIQGEIALSLKDYDLAQSKFIEVISFDKENSRSRSAGIHLLRLADLKIIQGSHVDASSYQSEALKILSATQDYWALAKAFSQTIFLLHKLGASQDAAHLASRTSAFIKLHGLSKDKAIFEFRRALVENALGNHEASFTHLNSAKAVIEDTLPKVQRRDLRQTYLALQKSVFELNVGLTLAQLGLDTEGDSITSSLLLAEAFKGRTLIESIRSSDSAQSIDTKQRIKRDKILNQIRLNALKWHESNQDSDSGASILSATRALSSDLEKLEASIKLARASSEQTKPKPIDSVLPKANIGELIAYYFTGEETSWLWVIVGDSKYVYNLSPEREIENLVSDVMANMTEAPASRIDGGAWQQTNSITKLSQEILSPLAKHIADNDISLITIIPDGALHALPFAPLIIPGHDKPLISDFAIAYAPSLFAKEELANRANNKDAGDQLRTLVVADPISTENSALSMSRLEHSRTEAQAVRSIVGGDSVLLLAENADKKSFLKYIEQPFGIMHFATHGLLNSKEPALSGLLFSSSKNNESLWLVPEISRSNISADLVVLSACDSSVGKHLSGEGLFSLSRAFIEGGADQVLGTLWKVEDLATAELMRLFYVNLVTENMAVAEALRHAQKAIYHNKDNDWNDPYFWAGFQLQGGGLGRTYASTKGI